MDDGRCAGIVYRPPSAPCTSIAESTYLEPLESGSHAAGWRQHGCRIPECWLNFRAHSYRAPVTFSTAALPIREGTRKEALYSRVFVCLRGFLTDVLA